jgi:hypothetical protein
MLKYFLRFNQPEDKINILLIPPQLQIYLKSCAMWTTKRTTHNYSYEN